VRSGPALRPRDTERIPYGKFRHHPPPHLGACSTTTFHRHGMPFGYCGPSQSHQAECRMGSAIAATRQLLAYQLKGNQIFQAETILRSSDFRTTPFSTPLPILHDVKAFNSTNSSQLPPSKELSQQPAHPTSPTRPPMSPTLHNSVQKATNTEQHCSQEDDGGSRASPLAHAPHRRLTLQHG